jgi:hypothetical protein
MCARPGNLLQDPVRSPYGHVFDKAVIAQCLKKLGNRCPLTGNPLTKSELVPDEDLHQEIREWQLARAREAAQPGGEEEAQQEQNNKNAREEKEKEEEEEEEDPMYVFD